ncbi:GNAT family N-acetyltransferase [Nocardioides antri]|uniref:GNAT family N-acetyltransferase n=1 Tax=Nocardioides antri TaxID=2607659 RepID=A0A5B1M449_9ACTN|nr:GNAT family protein [Nocardioides antri]KAA1427712.1 GNAT family N-acetyltransferase [Nocardioides antri]
MSLDPRSPSDSSAQSLPSLQVVPLTREHALDICTWRYAPPYECYDMTDADPDRLLQPEAGFHALLAGDRLIGFRSFGPDGQVPGWDYDDQALDTGGGLRPQLVGQGLGRAAISAGLAFGRAKLAPRAFRVTVATFNVRALRAVEGLGFQRVGQFSATTDGRSFEVLARPEG